MWRFQQEVPQGACSPIGHFYLVNIYQTVVVKEHQNSFCFALDPEPFFERPAYSQRIGLPYDQ